MMKQVANAMLAELGSLVRAWRARRGIKGRPDEAKFADHIELDTVFAAASEAGRVYTPTRMARQYLPLSLMPKKTSGCQQTQTKCLSTA